MPNLEASQNEIQKQLDSQSEWLLIESSGKTFALDRREIEISHELGKLLLGFLSDKGFQTWRINTCKIENRELILHLSRNFNKETEKIRLVPRISSAELNANLELARLEKANQIAAIVRENISGAKLVRVALNEENGRFAQIIFEHTHAERVAVLADITESLTPEIILSSAILWLRKLENRKKNPIGVVWILGEKKQARRLQKLHALLRENWKKKIKVFEFSRKDTKQTSETVLNEIANLKIEELWKTKPKEIKLTPAHQMTETAQKITNLFPEKIDIVFGRNGETLRFLGLPFARVRKIFDEEKAWFGVENNRQILMERSWRDFADLLENLNTFRRFDSPNKQHLFYRLAPEAWLEAILRRNIKLLDANLILSPLYHQFRAERDKIDLLALRSDGRLVIIEVKIAPDREMIFQAADYWQKIELQRRKGNLQKARLFGNAEIADAPAIVYLAAPTLSYHRDLEFLAKTVSPEIEIYQFNLNENWREKLRVLQTEKLI